MSASVVSSSLAWTDDWALFTRMSSPPKALTVAATAASTCARTPTSQASGSALPPRLAISAATASHFERVRPASATAAPSFASARAAPRPMP